MSNNKKKTEPWRIIVFVISVAFIVFILVANKLINNWRMHRTNERLSASDEGLRLMEIRDYKTIYLALLPEKGDETETAEEQNEERELGAGEE